LKHGAYCTTPQQQSQSWSGSAERRHELVVTTSDCRMRHRFCRGAPGWSSFARVMRARSHRMPQRTRTWRLSTRGEEWHEACDVQGRPLCTGSRSYVL